MQSINNDTIQKLRDRFSIVCRNDHLTKKLCLSDMVNCMLVIRLGTAAYFAVVLRETNARSIPC